MHETESSVVYRFRSFNSLLDEREELEKQSIYFATPEQLNDPVEGLRNIYWSGDKIAWENLFKHYIICLQYAIVNFIVFQGSEHKIKKEMLPVDTDGEKHLSERMIEDYEVVVKNVLQKPALKHFINLLSESQSKISKGGLDYILTLTHNTILNEIASSSEEVIAGSIPKFIDPDKNLEKLISASVLESIETIKKHGEPNTYFLPFGDPAIHRKQYDILNSLKNDLQGHHNYKFITIYFPRNYLDAIERIIFPDWCAACFMKSYRNSAVWAHYGDNHEGACLIFHTSLNGEIETIPLFRDSSQLKQPSKKNRLNLDFKKIDYVSKHGEIDFFRSIGRLPIPILEKMWFSDGNGGRSICAQDIFSDEHDFVKRYWDNFYRDITIKTKDWGYEGEHRLMINDFFHDLSTPDSRTLKYDFSSLKGIIFGINTGYEKIEKTLEIIKEKCKQNSIEEFKIYQAYYCEDERCIKKHELSALENYVLNQAF